MWVFCVVGGLLFFLGLTTLIVPPVPEMFSSPHIEATAVILSSS